jgi:hypothetical protein
MKKFVVLVLCLLVLGTSAFALDKAVGGGGMLWHAFVEGDSLTAFGGFAFFGLGRYVELNAGVITIGQGYYDATGVTFGIYGKYPFSISDRVVIFPTGGLDLEYFFAGDYTYADLWVRVGLGLDFFFTDTVFLRSHLIYGIDFPFEAYLDDRKPHGILFKVGIGYMF